jgi:hypothetical protein
MSIQWQEEVYVDRTPRPSRYPCRVCGEVVNHEPSCYCGPCLVAKLFGPYAGPAERDDETEAER